MRTIKDLYLNSMKKFKKNNMFTDGTTFEEGHLEVMKIVTFLISEGISKNDNIACHAITRKELLYLYWATQLLGCSYTSLDPMLPKSSIEKILEKLKPKYIYSDTETFENYKNIDILNIHVTNINIDIPIVNVNENDASLIIFSSGSTGNPKGIVLPHNTLYRSAEITSKTYELTENDILLSINEINLITTMKNLGFMGLYSGCTLAFRGSALNPLDLINSIEDQKVTIMTANPAFIKKLNLYSKKIKKEKLNSLKHIFSGGDILSKEETLLFYKNYNIKVFNTYGQTETVGVIISNKEDIFTLAAGCLGVSNGAEITIINGEIACKDLKPLYYISNDNKELRIHNDWLLTGDLAFKNKDNIYEFKSRKDFVLKNLKGEDLYPKEIEDIISLNSSVTESCIVNYKYPSKKVVLVLALVIIPGSSQENVEEEIRSNIRINSGESNVPTKFIYFNNLDKIHKIKLNRKSIEGRVKEIIDNER